MVHDGSSWGSPILRDKDRSIKVCGDRIVKRQSSVRSRIERERSRFGAHVATSCGLFDVPDVLSFDDANGEIVFQYVGGSVPLKKYFVVDPNTRLAERCGLALAHIHSAGSGNVDGGLFLHGDYGMSNILYSERDDRLTIVDWSNADWMGIPPGQSTGPAGLDLGIAILSMFHRTVIRGRGISFPERLSEAFLRGYTLVRADFRMAAEQEVLSLVQRRWKRHYFSQFGLLRTLSVMPSWLRVLCFLSVAQRRF